MSKDHGHGPVLPLALLDSFKLVCSFPGSLCSVSLPTNAPRPTRHFCKYNEGLLVRTIKHQVTCSHHETPRILCLCFRYCPLSRSTLQHTFTSPHPYTHPVLPPAQRPPMPATTKPQRPGADGEPGRVSRAARLSAERQRGQSVEGAAGRRAHGGSVVPLLLFLTRLLMLL